MPVVSRLSLGPIQPTMHCTGSSPSVATRTANLANTVFRNTQNAIHAKIRSISLWITKHPKKAYLLGTLLIAIACGIIASKWNRCTSNPSASAAISQATPGTQSLAVDKPAILITDPSKAFFLSMTIKRVAVVVVPLMLAIGLEILLRRCSSVTPSPRVVAPPPVTAPRVVVPLPVTAASRLVIALSLKGQARQYVQLVTRMVLRHIQQVGVRRVRSPEVVLMRGWQRSVEATILRQLERNEPLGLTARQTTQAEEWVSLVVRFACAQGTMSPTSSCTSFRLSSLGIQTVSP